MWVSVSPVSAVYKRGEAGQPREITSAKRTSPGNKSSSSSPEVAGPKPALVTGVKLISARLPSSPPQPIPAKGAHQLYPRVPDGEPIKLPESLESLPKSDHFPTQRHRWNTNEEIASMLIAFDRHHDWMSKEVKIRPKSGSMLLYSRKKVRYRRDGYCWKKRKDGKTTREDHMKLKVQGMECIYGCYVHSAILPTFHRRCYWLLQNPDIVLVHYLNVPYPDDNKMLVTNSVTLWGDKKEWTKEELVSQLKPMFFSEEEPDLNSELEISTTETVEAIVSQLLEKQRNARTMGAMECSCPDSTCLDSKTCIHQATKSEAQTTSSGRSRNGRGGMLHHRHLNENNNQVSSTTGNNGLMLAENHSPGSGHSTPSRGHTPLVLSLSQLQGSGGLVILNSNSGPTSTTSSHPLHVRQLSVCSPAPATPSPRPVSRTCEPDISSATRGEVGSVSAAVNTLTNIHEFSLDLNNGNYDSGYSGLQPVTDSLLSGSESRKSDEGSIKSESDNHAGPLLDFKSAFSDLDNKNDMSFLHETLDLSQDDIHRTLSANLPACSEQSKPSPSQQHTHHSHTQRHHGTHHLHSMDYASTESSHTQSHASFDVNLDAFDILSDFPELSHYEGGSNNGLINNGHPGPMLSQAATNSNSHIGATIKTRTLEYRENLVTITDYSPGWSYTDGEEKILVTGPWYSQTSPYQILFDGLPVPTTLVQSGVLRCFCPAHGAGLVILEVACEGDVISKSVIFEYKSPAGSTSTFAKTKKNPSLKERDLRTILLRKLESLDICTVDDKDIFLEQELDKEENFSEFEDQLVTMCQKLTSEDWTTDEGIASDIGHNSSTTLLHLGASLGLCRLVCSLLHWAAEHPGRRLGREVDALAKDSEGYTPLMRACANGKKEIATILYHWNSAAAKIKNKDGLTCVELAGKSSCPDFKQELEDLEEQKMLEQMESSSTITPESLSKNPKAEFLKPVEKITKKVIRAPSLEGHLNIPSNTRRSPSPLGTFGMRSASASVRNLRAASPASNQGEASGFKLKLTKQPSVDSGINLDVQAVKNIQKDIRQLSKNDRSLSLPSTGFQKTMSLQENPILVAGRSKVSKKETDGSVKSFENPDSPFIDVEAISSDDEDSNVIEPDPAKRPGGEDQSKEDQKVLTLAEQFLAAMPDRIKFESTTVDDDDDSMIFPDCCSSGGADCCSQSEDLGVESMADDQSVDFEFNFEEACQSYRDVSTPTSSLSPASFTLESPRSSFHESPSPCLSFNFDRRSPPTTAELSEFLQASAKCEKDLSNLTLSEMEQRELYQAAQIIQKAYRSYKGRKKTPTRPRVSPEGLQEGEDQAKEAKAAVVIQNYYRRYKQYCYWKQMAKAATLIQNKYRTYCEHKRFKKSQKAATCIQTYYRNYKEHQSQVRNRNSDEKESTPTAGLKRTYSQRRQHQAARKIQQFMRQTHLKLQTARVATHVEREKLPTLEFHMGCQQRCHMDITDMDTDMATMDMLDIIPCFKVGQGTTHTHQIPSQEQIKDSSASEDDHPEPKSYRKTYEKK